MEVNVICPLILIICVINGVISETQLIAPDNCPVGDYHCKNSAKKVCIALNKICDGINDCPEGDDELFSYCKQVSMNKNYKNYNPGKNYTNKGNQWVDTSNPKLKKSLTRDDNWADGENPYYINNGCAAGSYLCNGTLNICVKLNDLCDGYQDCPKGDDEDKKTCKNWTKPKSVIDDGEKSSGAQSAPKIESQAYDSNSLLKKLVGNQNRAGSNNFAGTGFMFHVENLVIYNSQVKMFDQNSDNSNKS